MILKYNVTEEDYINFNIEHFYRSKKMKSTRDFTKFAPIITVFLFMFVLTGYTFSWYILAVTSVFAVMWIAIQHEMWKMSFIKRSRTHIENRGASFLGEQEMNLTEEYIEVTNSKTFTKTPYSAIEKACYGHNTIYLYISVIEAFLIPISAFSNEEEKKNFFDVLTEKTGLDFSDIIEKIKDKKKN